MRTPDQGEYGNSGGLKAIPPHIKISDYPTIPDFFGPTFEILTNLKRNFVKFFDPLP